MTLLTPERKGELAILLSALLWGLFPVITILTFSGVTPLFSVAVSTLISAVFFAALLTLRQQWSFLRDRRAWRAILLTSLCIGVLFYGLLFTGLRYTTAGNAAILSLMEVFFSFLILGFLLKREKLMTQHIVGAMCMLLGASFILLPKASGWHKGDLLIILATAIAPVGNMYTQEARKIVPTAYILFCRNLLSGIFLFFMTFLFEPLPGFDALWVSSGFLLVNGILLLGLSKMLWIESAHLLPITKVVSLESIFPFFTLVVAFLVLHEKVSSFQIIGLLPILAGVFLLTRKKSRVELPIQSL